MSDIAADPLIYTRYGEARDPGGWRPGALSLSLAAALVTCLISGAVIVSRISDLPNIDTLFEPQIVQTAPAQMASARPMAVLADVAASPSDIDIAPTPPVYIEPYASDYDAPPVTPTADDYAYDPNAPIETAAPVLTRAEAQDAYGDLADALATSNDGAINSSSVAPPQF
ncbi:MAG TPA: hypothetical protein VN042_13640 [Asticcacaulis sp.]|nr:hypothetical protein [Asticcacaulis sp.]